MHYALRRLLIAVAMSSPAAFAQHGEATDGEGHTPHSTLGVFIGDTTEERRDGLTLGIEYEYRASERFGVGVIAEHVAGNFDTNVFVLPAAYHRGPWKLYAGPGIERGREGEEPLLRLGVEYGFHVGDFEVSPQFDVDFVGGDRLLIFGVVFAVEL